VNLIGGPQSIPAGLFRKTTSARLNAKLNSYALSGWCLQVLAEASLIKAPPYQTGSVTDEFLNDLVRLSAQKAGPKLAQEALRQIGVILVIVPHLKNTYLDGAVFMTLEGRPIIGLTLRYDKETQADSFAESHLLPKDFDLDQQEVVSTFDVLTYAHEHGIAPAIVAGRIQHTKQNYRLFANLLGRGEVTPVFGIAHEAE